MKHTDRPLAAQARLRDAARPDAGRRHRRRAGRAVVRRPAASSGAARRRRSIRHNAGSRCGAATGRVLRRPASATSSCRSTPPAPASSRRSGSALLALPFGTSGSYGDIAQAIGKPAAMRAVGAAVGRNPIGIIVPCHRVLGRDGSLTGYAGGLRSQARAAGAGGSPALAGAGASRLKQRDLLDLMLLAALWGASFLFMRLGAAEFGPVALAAIRVVIASAVLLPLLAAARPAGLHAPPLAADRAGRAGQFGAALPGLRARRAVDQCRAGFDLQRHHADVGRPDRLALARRPAGAAAQRWAWRSASPASSGWPGTRPRSSPAPRRRAGPSPPAWPRRCCTASAPTRPSAGWPACRRWRVAAGSQLAASLVLVGPALFAWPAQAPGATAWGAAIALGAVLHRPGLPAVLPTDRPGRALERGGGDLLIPLFAMLWGGLFLGEQLTPTMAGGGALILLGTGLATGLWSPAGLSRWRHR